MVRTRLSWVTLIAFTAACGSEAPTTPPEPTPTPTAAPTATPTAVPTAAPTASPAPVSTGEEVFPGPVKTVKVRLYAVVTPSGQHREGPFYDPRTDNDVVQKGDFIVLDVTPKNDQGQKCDGDRDPEWILENDKGRLARRPSSNPYLYRADTVGGGVVQVRATVDGVLSNLINIEIR